MRRFYYWSFGGVLTLSILLLGGSTLISAQELEFPLNIDVRDTCHYEEFDRPAFDGYGVPYNLFADSDSMLITNYCLRNDVRMQAGDGKSTTYIYRYGHYWDNNRWNRLDLEPIENGERVGEWITGKAETTFSLTSEKLMSRQYAVVYTCQWIDGGWKCGCQDQACASSQWQLQSFSYKANEVSATQLYEAAPDALKAPITPVMSVVYSPRLAASGDRVSIQGFGLEKNGTTVAFRREGQVVATVLTQYTGPMSQFQGASVGSFIVPNLPSGRYLVSLQNPEGNEERAHYFVVKGDGAAPTISSFSPTSGPYGAEVTLLGNNFTNEAVVYDSFGGYRTVSTQANGTRLSFDLEPYAGAKQIWYERGLATINAPLHMYVITENGFSNLVGPFTFTQ